MKSFKDSAPHPRYTRLRPKLTPYTGYQAAALELRCWCDHIPRRLRMTRALTLLLAVMLAGARQSRKIHRRLPAQGNRESLLRRRRHRFLAFAGNPRAGISDSWIIRSPLNISIPRLLISTHFASIPTETKRFKVRSCSTLVDGLLSGYDFDGFRWDSCDREHRSIERSA